MPSIYLITNDVRRIPCPAKYHISIITEVTMKIDEILSELDNRPDDNFTAEDLHHLSKIRDLSKAQEFALSLINKPSKKPLTTAKRAWFERAIRGATSVQKLTKMLWDMMLSGEGHSVIGTRHSTDPNSYRKQFGEDATGPHYSRAYELGFISAMTPDGQIHHVKSKHDGAALPVGSILLSAEEHRPGQYLYQLYKKVDDSTDIMTNSFEDLGFLKVGSYAKAAEVAAAFKDQASKLV